MKTKRRNQEGTALIFALIFLLILSVMAASLMFLAQSETWSSSNYRLMTQGRYGAEAGLNLSECCGGGQFRRPSAGYADSGLWGRELYGLRQAAVHAAGTNRGTERPSR